MVEENAFKFARETAGINCSVKSSMEKSSNPHSASGFKSNEQRPHENSSKLAFDTLHLSQKFSIDNEEVRHFLLE